MAKRRGSGWHGEPVRHALAARGISTIGPVFVRGSMVVKRTPLRRVKRLNAEIEKTLRAGVSLQDIQRVVGVRNPWFSWEELTEITRELKILRIELKIAKVRRKTEKHRLMREKLKTRREIEEARRADRVTAAVAKERVKGEKVKRSLTQEEWQVIKEKRRKPKEPPMVKKVLVP